MIVSSSAIRIRTPGRRVEGRAYPSMSCGSSQLGRRHGPRDVVSELCAAPPSPERGMPRGSGEEEVVDQEPDERPCEAAEEQAEEQPAKERDGLPRLGGARLLVPGMILARPGVVGLRRALVERARFLGETLMLLSVPASLHPSVPQRDGRCRPEPQSAPTHSESSGAARRWQMSLGREGHLDAEPAVARQGELALELLPHEGAHDREARSLSCVLVPGAVVG